MNREQRRALIPLARKIAQIENLIKKYGDDEDLKALEYAQDTISKISSALGLEAMSYIDEYILTHHLIDNS